MAAAKRERPVLEWIMAALGLILTLAVIGVIAADAVRPQRPAAFEIRLTEARRTPSGWVAQIEIANRGDAAAAAVQVEGRLGAETAMAQIDYVPGGGRERASLGFAADPRAGLDLTVRGWSEP
ncbi:MAG: hypothetical protein KKA16_02170 [Alphaproteobacteria bacterium]|nr:hypothetical protein [Alphaproteobacteria bacterium]MBU2380791.1 hypothetical protein [Alphaproteobacteria bacterium]